MENKIYHPQKADSLKSQALQTIITEPLYNDTSIVRQEIYFETKLCLDICVVISFFDMSIPP